MNLTIKDIAKIAGVAPSTVSKVINNYPGVSKETKDKVDKIIADHEYQPTFSAKSLATKKSQLIALIYAGKINVDFTHPFFNQVMTSFKRVIGELGYDIVMFSNEKFQQESNYLARCRHFQVDGCLIIAGEQIEDAVYELVQSPIPCVGVDLQLEGPNFSYVMTDNMKMSWEVVEHLYLQNIREIGFINGKKDSAIAMLREKGFRYAAKQFGISIREEWMQSGDFYEESGYLAMKRILDQPSSPPKAIFAASDLMAFGAKKAMTEAGLNIPQDICLIGCDDIDACKYSTPQLTTVKQDKDKLGKLAAFLLNDLINGKKEVNPILVDPELILRESCSINKSRQEDLI